jgi:hypothetical protein
VFQMLPNLSLKPTRRMTQRKSQYCACLDEVSHLDRQIRQ